MQNRPAMNAADSPGQLCLACGLCCDGTLFHDVRLGPGDDPGRLEALGLPIKGLASSRKGARFPQPCAALCADRRCRVYDDRPLQCHIFECGVYKDLAGGRIEFPVALRLVKQARQRAEKIRKFLQQLGDSSEEVSLSVRFQRTQRRMESTPLDEETAGAFAELTLTVHQLNVLTHEKFYTKADDEGNRP